MFLVFIGVLETPKFVDKAVAFLSGVITYKFQKKGTIGKPCFFINLPECMVKLVIFITHIGCFDRESIKMC
jgi:hypothetical protein